MRDPEEWVEPGDAHEAGRAGCAVTSVPRAFPDLAAGNPGRTAMRFCVRRWELDLLNELATWGPSDALSRALFAFAHESRERRLALASTIVMGGLDACADLVRWPTADPSRLLWRRAFAKRQLGESRITVTGLANLPARRVPRGVPVPHEDDDT